MRRMGVLAIGCCLLLGACGGDDGEPEGASGATTTQDGKRAPAEKRLKARDLPFTFRFPGEFRAVPKAERPPGFRAILGVDRLNFVDVRLTAARELSDDRSEREVRTALGDGVTTESVAREERGTGLKTVRFIVLSKSGGADLRSQLIFFRAGGRTWELGCQSTAAGRARIDAACERALETLRVRT